MDRRLFFLLNMAQHRLYKYADSECEQHLGISVTQTAALMFIAKNEGCLQKNLGLALGLNKPAVTGLVGRMVKNELIIRKASAEDRRASLLYLSNLGKQKLPFIFPLINEVNEALRNEFSEEELETVARFLNKVIQDFQ